MIDDSDPNNDGKALNLICFEKEKGMLSFRFYFCVIATIVVGLFYTHCRFAQLNI